MAGSQKASIHEHHRGIAEAAPEFSRWLIGFARFVQYPSSPSPFPGLKTLGKRELDYPPHGTWLSTSSSTVSVQLADEVNGSDVILTVVLGGKVLEEHYISKLNFSWPQMSCVSGFPSRGSRAIFVSYKDSANEVQKFALRFSTCDAAKTFVVALKDKLKGLKEAGNQKTETWCEVSIQSDYNSSNEIVPSYVPELLPRPQYEAQNQRIETRSEVSILSDYNPSNETVPRATEEEPPYMLKPLNSYVPEMLPGLEYQTGQTLYPPQSALSQIPHESSINLPPSFTTLLSGCFPNSTLDAGQPTVKQDPDLKSQILKYMEDSSFQDMLQNVERIIDEIGGNWIL